MNEREKVQSMLAMLKNDKRWYWIRSNLGVFIKPTKLSFYLQEKRFLKFEQLFLITTFEQKK